ncbi:MAG TPA: hypothetical protein VFS21_15285 [Roseiflexaceae bacterium]|nr:hypothetical protein [Roseiflexaceae bacterium]
MPRYPQQPDFATTIEGDLYRLHRRPGHPQVIVNSDYQGVKVLNPLTGALISEHAFPEGYSSDGIIDHWFFSADGSKLLTVCEEDRSVALIDLVEKQGSSLVEYPPIDRIGSAVYIWDETFVFVSGMVSRYFALEKTGDRYSFAEKRSIDIRMKYPDWRRAVDQVYTNKWSIERVDSKEKSLFYHDYHSHLHKVGMLSWQTSDHFSVPLGENTPKFASDGRYVFALKEYLLQVFDIQGEMVSSFGPSDGSYFIDVDVFTVENKTVLVLLSAFVNQNIGQLLVYVFEREQ